MSADDTGPRATRFANITLGVAASLCLVDLYFAYDMRRVLFIKCMYGAFAAFLLAATRLRPSRRVSVALVILPLFVGTYLVAYLIERKRPPPGTAAVMAGRGWDGRSRWEVVEDLRKGGRRVFPSVGARSLLTAEYLGVPMRRQQMLPKIGGAEVVPLGAISGVTTVMCNEGGFYATYESDEHGFNNPKGLWGAARIEVAAVGDSFTHGFCVAPDKAVPSRIRERYPATLNIGIGGNGPLLDLAGITEYLPERKPKVVLWFYFNNDLGDLEVERKHPLLMRYLDDGFRQGLLEKQAAIDAGLEEILTTRVQPIAPRWPTWLGHLGIPRRRTPMWFQDLVTRETHSAGASAIRLDRVNSVLTAKLGLYSEQQGPPRRYDFDLFEQVLVKAKERVSAWGGTLYFVYVPDMLFLRKKAAHPNREKALAAAREVGLPIIDVHAVFSAEPDPDRVMFHSESHCNEEGYLLMAKTVLGALEGKI